MEVENISLLLSLVATVLSVLSFMGASWRIWRDRPRLRFCVSKVTQHNTADGKKFNQLEIKISNLGFRSIILTGFKAIGRTGVYYMGDNDPTAMAYGICEPVFPANLASGQTLNIYPMTVDALERNQTDPQDPKHHFNPYEFFVLEDSFGHYHPIYVQDVLRALHMVKTWRPRRGIKKLTGFLYRKWFFYKAAQHKF